MATLDFEFYAGAIEDAIVQQLTSKVTGVNAVDTYSGQLDDPKEVERALSSKGRKFPMMLVSYADGEDSRAPGYSPVAGRPLVFRHDCFFAVICLSNDSRGEQARRRGMEPSKGIYSLIGQADMALTGMRFSTTVDGESKLLTIDPIEPVSVEYVPLPNLTAYARIYATAFKWQSPDRTPEPVNVTDFDVEVNSLNRSGPERRAPELPGVTAEVGSRV